MIVHQDKASLRNEAWDKFNADMKNMQQKPLDVKKEPESSEPSDNLYARIAKLETQVKDLKSWKDEMDKGQPC